MPNILNIRISLNMNLNLDKVPTNLEEAVSLLKDALNEEERDIISEMTVSKLHFTVGRFIRNEWSLWATENVLTKWFKKNYSVEHADDVSSIIIECLIADLNGRPRQDREIAKEFIEHWNKHKKKIKE